MGWTGQSVCNCRWVWWEYLWEWVGMVEVGGVSVGVGGSGGSICRSGWEWSEYLWKWWEYLWE